MPIQTRTVIATWCTTAKRFCRRVYEHQVLPPKKWLFNVCRGHKKYIGFERSQIFLLNFPWRANRKRGPLRSETRLLRLVSLLLLFLFSYSIWSGECTTRSSVTSRPSSVSHSRTEHCVIGTTCQAIRLSWTSNTSSLLWCWHSIGERAWFCVSQSHCS